MKATFLCSFRAFLGQMLWKESFITCQILNWKENKASNFETKRTTRKVLTWYFYKVPDYLFKKKSTHRILKLNFFDMSIFERKRIRRVGFWIKNASAFVLKFFIATDLDLKKIITRLGLNIKKTNASDFLIQGKRRIRFLKQNLISHQILKSTFIVWSDFELKTFTTC